MRGVNRSNGGVVNGTTEMEETVDLTVFEKVLRLLGVTKVRRGHTLRYLRFPTDFADEDIRLHRRIEKYTMTRPARIYSLRKAVHYVCSANVAGAFVECGVWKGGSVMAMALSLDEVGERRELYLFDTFEGMPAPSNLDVTVTGHEASDTFERKKTSSDRSTWDYASLDEVQANVLSTGYDPRSLHFIKGKVEETIPVQAPEKIALLRLDTDFFRSTRHELLHLYSRVVGGGIIILDDYGHWQGARQAVDEFMSDLSRPPFLARVDFAARLIVKPSE